MVLVALSLITYGKTIFYFIKDLGIQTQRRRIKRFWISTTISKKLPRMTDCQ